MKQTLNRSWNGEGYAATWRDAVNIIDKLIEPWILQSVDIKKGGRVLECGVGSGKWSAGFALLGYHVYAMDNNGPMLRRAHDNFPNISFECIEKDIRNAPLIEPPVDLIFNEGVIEHFMNDNERKDVLTNFYNAVKGYVAIIVPAKSEKDDEIYYTAKKLRDELKDVGFSVFNSCGISFSSGDGVTTIRQVGAIGSK